MMLDTEHNAIHAAWTAVVLEDAGLISRPERLSRDRRSGLWTRNHHFLAYTETETILISLALARWALDEYDIDTWNHLVFHVYNYYQ